MANLTEVKTVFTIDLSPYLSGLKTMLTMTQQTGAQLQPLLNLQIDKADFTELEKTFAQYQEQVKSLVPVADEAANASDKLGGANEETEKKTRRSTQAQGEHELSLKKSKREALEAYGAIMFLSQGILRMASSATGGSKELEKVNRAMSEGVGQGFELAGLLGMLGIASGGTAVMIGALATVAVTLARVLSDTADATALNDRLQKDFAATLNGLTNAQLDQYIRSTEAALVTIRNQIAAEQEKNKVLNDQAGPYASINAWLNQILGSTKEVGDMQETQKKLEADLLALREKRSGQTKQSGDIEQFIQQKTIDAIENRYRREEAAATKAYNDELAMINSSAATDNQKREARKVAEEAYYIKLKELREREVEETKQKQKELLEAQKQVASAYTKAAEDRFESELNLLRSSMIQQGAAQETIDLRMIQIRRARYEAQLSELAKIVGPLSPEALQKQSELDKQITQLEAQEAEKRKGIKQGEKDFTSQMADLQMQEVLARVRLRGIEQGKTEEQIQQELFDRKKQALEAELGLIKESAAEGETLDNETLLRKQELQNALNDITVEGEELRERIAKEYRRRAQESIQETASNLTSYYSDLFALQQQQTEKAVESEKKGRQSALDAERDKRLAVIENEREKVRASKLGADERAAIEKKLSLQRESVEKDYATKTTALNEEMNAKAKSMNADAFKQWKQIEKINTYISTYSSAQKAFESVVGIPVVGPALAVTAAATAVAAGLARVAVIDTQEVPGLERGGRLKKGDVGFIEGYHNEIVAPEKTFVDVFREDLAPRVIDVLVPQIRAAVLANIVYQNGGGDGSGSVVNYVTIQVENYYGNEEYFDKVLKPKIEEAMQKAGRSTLVSLFRNPNKPQRSGAGAYGAQFISEI